MCSQSFAWDILRGRWGTTASELEETPVRISWVAWSRSSILWAWLRTRVRTGSCLSLRSANLMYLSSIDVDVHEWSSAYLRICEAFRFIHIDGLFMGQISEVPKSCHLDKVQYNPLQLYIRNHLAISYIPFRIHVHFSIQLWEKKLKLKNSVLWIYSLPGGPADFRAFSHAMQTLA